MTFAAFFCLEWTWKGNWTKLGGWSTLPYSHFTANSFAVFYISDHLYDIFGTALMVFYLLLASLACLAFWKPGRGNNCVGEVAAAPRAAPEEPCQGHEQELSSLWAQNLLTQPLLQDQMGKEDERRGDRCMDRQFQGWFWSVFNPSWGFCSDSQYCPWLKHWGGFPPFRVLISSKKERFQEKAEWNPSRDGQHLSTTCLSTAGTDENLLWNVFLLPFQKKFFPKWKFTQWENSVRKFPEQQWPHEGYEWPFLLLFLLLKQVKA